jgi:hypothetical protein
MGSKVRYEWEGPVSDPRVEDRLVGGGQVSEKIEVTRFYLAPGSPDPKLRMTRFPDFSVGLGEVPPELRPARLNRAPEFIRAVIDDFAGLVP